MSSPERQVVTNIERARARGKPVRTERLIAGGSLTDAVLGAKAPLPSQATKLGGPQTPRWLLALTGAAVLGIVLTAWVLS